ncbi:hypothetical protein EAO69_13190 [Streptomyces sp. me109]|uniref:MmyB family transcriptional regulator n=1 Tax=Streptomyces sp. me109 TaxID=1827853 RepID=UPI0011CEBCF5|nr:hypothetical protein [Streptomyces sp. me109]TXS75348.1 hypothetical protein EAO69_13190 [Streptomyces sp. me109]
MCPRARVRPLLVRAPNSRPAYWHPLVGDLHFSYEFMHLPGDDNQTLCVYLPEPDSATAESLRILSSWNASTTDTAPDPRPSAPGS